MPDVKPRVVIRLGTHAEKIYLEKTLKFFDGLILGANLVESTPGATASLLVKFGGAKRKQRVYIDPMTYAFGAYVDDRGRVRTDLNWIRSETKGSGDVTRDFKRSYQRLAKAFGEPFEGAIVRGKALKPGDFVDDETMERCCRGVVEYQLTRIRNEMSSDAELREFGDAAPQPSVVFAPYFYCVPGEAARWLDLVLKLATKTNSLEKRAPVHAVICADQTCLDDLAFVKELKAGVGKTGVKGVWIWLSGLSEDETSAGRLKTLRGMVAELSERVEVYNMHGGYFSLALSKFGLTGVSHGIGYGERKDVLPVIGQSMPMVRYHLPPARRRFGVPDIDVCFDSVGIHRAEDFFREVCDCAICKGVIGDAVANFAQFGDMHFSRADAKRKAQTPAAAKKCRFHYLLARLRERDRVRVQTLDEIVDELKQSRAKWSSVPTMKRQMSYLDKWVEALVSNK